MTNGSVSYEKRFLEWLAKQVSPAQLSVVYSAFADINSFCLSRKILEKPLFETDDLVTLSNVRETVEHNAVFAFSYRKQKPTMIVAIRHYCHFIKETTDEFTFTSSVKSESAVPATNIASKDKPSPTALFENSNRLKFIEWLDNRGVSPGDTFAILSSLKRCTERVKAEKIISDDIYHITSADTMNAVRSFLLADKNFIYADRHKDNWLTNALSLYLEFFSEQIVPNLPGNVAETGSETETFSKMATPTVSEIEALLSDDIFSPLKVALAKENIRTIEELKAMKLWAFMNQNNLYSISMRQTILTKVRQLLEPETAENPELLYELHCGSTVYSGDTLAKSFLYFCEDTAQKYPLIFRSLLGKTIGDTSDVKIYRSPESGNFIRMENPTCYIRADLARESVIAAVKWIAWRCMGTTIPVSVKEPDSLLKRLSHTEMPQEKFPAVALATQKETESPACTSTFNEMKPSEPVANNSDEQRLNLAEKCSFAYTKPTGFSYKGKTVSCVSWNSLYVKLVCELYSDYEALFQFNMHFAGSSNVDFGSRVRMRYPKVVSNNIYLECNVSATEIVRKIRWLLDYCSVNADDVVITYRRMDGGGSPQTIPAGHCAAHAAPMHTIPSQDHECISPDQVAKVEKIVLEADMSGVTYDSLCNALGLTMVATKTLVQQCKRILEVKGRLYHEESFIDWDDGARQMCYITEKLMLKNNGYISAMQLYDYARAEMNMFLNDNDMNDERSVYEIAQHLFEKNNYKGCHYVFTGKTHISKPKDAISSNFDIICKFAEDQGGVFREEDLAEYLAKIGIRAGSIRNQMRLNKEPSFFSYEPGTIISAKSMKIDDSWKEVVGRALHNLLSDADDHVVLRQIQPVWYESLPVLPEHRSWTPLLLQYVLRFYGEEFGVKTIMAMESQNMDTLHAMLVTVDSPIQNFGDAVIACLIESDTKQRSFEAEELRRFLVNTGMIQGNELIGNMPKALAKDERFAWDAKGENVTVRV